MVTSIDELGLTCSHPLSPFHSEFAGHGDWICRFKLVPIAGGTSITVACHVRSRWHDDDVSRDKQGLRMQELLERVFAAELLHAPYLNRED